MKNNNLEKLFNLITDDMFFQNKKLTYNLENKEIFIGKKLRISMPDVAKNNYTISLYFKPLNRWIDIIYNNITNSDVITHLKDNSKTRKLYIEQPEGKTLKNPQTGKDISF